MMKVVRKIGKHALEAQGGKTTLDLGEEEKLYRKKVFNLGFEE